MTFIRYTKAKNDYVKMKQKQRSVKMNIVDRSRITVNNFLNPSEAKYRYGSTNNTKKHSL